MYSKIFGTDRRRHLSVSVVGKSERHVYVKLIGAVTLLGRIIC